MAKKGYRILRHSFCLLNCIIWVAGCGILGIGIWLHLVHEGYALLLPQLSLFSIDSLCIAAGIITFITTFFGCCGSWFQNRCMLITYFVLVIFICIVELVAVTLALVYQEGVRDGLRAELKEGIKFHYNTTTQHTFDELWDRLQTQFGCCGVDSYEDWYGIHAWPTKSQVPPSCCTPEALQDYGPNNCAVSAEPGHFHTSGCYERLKDWLMERVHIVTIMGVFLAALQLFGLLSSLVLFCSLQRRTKSPMHTYRSYDYT